MPLRSCCKPYFLLMVCFFPAATAMLIPASTINSPPHSQLSLSHCSTGGSCLWRWLLARHSLLSLLYVEGRNDSMSPLAEHSNSMCWDIVLIILLLATGSCVAYNWTVNDCTCVQEEIPSPSLKRCCSFISSAVRFAVCTIRHQITWQPIFFPGVGRKGSSKASAILVQTPGLRSEHSFIVRQKSTVMIRCPAFSSRPFLPLVEPTQAPSTRY